MWCKLRVALWVLIYSFMCIWGPMLFVDEWLETIIVIHAAIVFSLIVVGGLTFLEKKCEGE